MKTKSLSLFVFSVLTFLVLISFASALILVDNPTTLVLNGEDGNGTITITNSDSDGNFNISSFDSSLTFTDSNSKNAVVTITVDDQTDVSKSIFSLNVSSVASGFLIGEFDKTFTINATNASNSSITDSETVTVTFIESFCSSGTKDDTDLTLDVNIDNFGEGDDEDWLPLDRIEVEVELKKMIKVMLI